MKFRDIYDLNVFMLCTGAAQIKYPGLNFPTVVYDKKTQERTLTQQHKDTSTGAFEIQERKKDTKKKKVKRAPLLRGWTGRTLKGTKIGPPEPVGGCKTY